MIFAGQTGYPSIDKPWLNYYSKEAINSKPFEGNIWENIYSSNVNYLEDVALIYFGKKISYKEMFNQIDAAARAFSHVGVKEGDIVILCMPAMPETIYSILALNKLGATANLLNPLFNEEQLVARIKDTEAKVMVVANEVYDMVKGAIYQTQIETVISLSAVNSLGAIVSLLKKVKPIERTTTWNAFIKNGKNSSYETVDYLPEDVAIVVYSSGTTGASKGIQLTNSSINNTICEGGNIDFEWERQDRWFNPIPIWFSTSICASVLVPMKYGITVILEPQYDFEVFAKHIIKYQPNFSISAAGLYQYLERNYPKNNSYKSFKFMVCGGEYITSQNEKKLNDWLANNGAQQNLHRGYGMCECGGTVTCSAYKCNIPGSAGIPTPHVVVAAFDLESDEELKYGERGEIRVYSNCHMKGYFKNQEATDKYFWIDKEGRKWCCTGDMGYVSSDGNVYISGRISDSYVNNGEIIYLFDIERSILTVNEINQCKTVVSIIDSKPVHICHVAVELGADVNDVLKRAKEYCAEHLSERYVPRMFKVYEGQLPVSLSGKLDISKMINDIENIIEI